MIKCITNINDSGYSQNITIETKAVVYNNGVYSFYDPESIGGSSNCYYKLNSSRELFIKVKINNLCANEKIKHVDFSFVFNGSPVDTFVKAYKLTSLQTNFGNDPEALHLMLSKDCEHLVDYAPLPMIINYASAFNNHQTISFDITDLVKLYGQSNPEFIFAVATDNSIPLVSLYDPSYISSLGKEVANAVVIEECGINNLNEYDNFSFSNYDNCSVNIKNGQIISEFNTFKSSIKNIPLSFSMAHNAARTTDGGSLPYKLKANFEYDIYEQNNFIIIEDYLGTKMAYKKMSNDQDENYLEMLGIKHVDDNNKNKLYYCMENGSYLFKDTITQQTTIIEVYDLNDNYIKYVLDDGITKITKSRNRVGEEITFVWEDVANNNLNPAFRLTSIEYLGDDLITISYNSSFHIKDVTFIREDEKASFSYIDSLKQVIYMLYDIHNSTSKLLGRIDLILSSNMHLDTAIERDYNQSIKRRIYYSYAFNKIDAVTICDKSNYVVYKTDYTFDQEYTKLDRDGNYVCHYFDKYGRTTLVIDNDGIIQTSNYGEIEDGALKGAICVSKALPWARNLIANHSFEYMDNADNIISWIKSGQGTATLANNSLYGKKCLKLETTSGQSVRLRQEIERIDAGSYTLKCKAKGSATDVVKITIGVYSRNSEYCSLSFETSLCDVTDEWEEFTLSANIPTIGDNNYIRVDIYSNGANEVYIDDLQFATANQIVRYNMLDNSSLDIISPYANLPANWTFENRQSLDELDNQPDNDFCKVLGNNSMHFHAISNIDLYSLRFNPRKMHQQINYSGLKNNVFSFGVFAKAYVTQNDYFKAYITFDYDNIGEKTYYFEFEKGIYTWQLLSRDIMAEDDYSSITIGITYIGIKEVYIDGFQLCKDASIVYYNYDKKSRIIDVGDASGNYQTIKHIDMQVSEITTKDGASFKYSYLDDGKLKKIEDMNGNTITYSYANQDASDNLVAIEIKSGSEIIEKEYEYDSDDNLTKETDEYLNEINYTHDCLRRINSITYPNGSVQRFNYDRLSNLIELSRYASVASQNPSYKTTISHDETVDEVSDIVSLNGKQYSFTHDSNGRLLTISENGTIVHTFTYDRYINNIQTSLVTSKQYDVSGDSFLFDYDSRKRLVRVYLNTHYSPIYEYEYNEMSLVSLVKDHVNNICQYYSYDLKGNLTKVTTKDLIIEYEYDNLGSVQFKKTIQGQKTKIQSYDYDYEYNNYSRAGFLKRLVYNYGDDIVISDSLGKGEYGLAYTDKQVNYYKDTSINSTLLYFDDKRNCITYNLDTLNSDRTSSNSGGKHFDLGTWKKYYRFNKTFYMMFKPFGSFGSKVNLFKLINAKLSPSPVASMDITESGHIKYTSASQSGASFSISSGTVSLNNWNYLSLTIYYDKTNNHSLAKMQLVNNNGSYTAGPYVINEAPYNMDSVSISRQDISPSPHPESSSSEEEQGYQLSIPFYISIIGFSNINFQNSQSQEIYDAWIKYYANNYKIDNVSISTLNIDESGCDAIALNGNLESINGLKPITNLVSVDSFDADKETCFKYDSTLMRKVFRSFSDDGFSPLAYSKALGTEGTISLWFRKEGEVARNRVIFSIYQNTNTRLSAFLYSSTLYIGLGGTNLSYANLVNDYSWHNIRFEWIQGQLTFKFDGVQKSVINISLSGNYALLVGSSLSSKDYALNGYIESLIISDSYHAFTQSEIERTRPTTIGYSLDALNRVTKKQIVIGEDSYDTLYAYDKTRIISEKFHNDNTINYTYDSCGNIATVVLGNIQDQYTYDKLGRLTYHNSVNGNYYERYYYDSNGDITCRNINDIDIEYEFSYDSKHRLLSVTKENLNYRVLSYPTDSYYPSSINFYNNGVLRKNTTFTWQGRRLISASLGGTSTIQFGYNDEGIMIYRNTPNESYHYTLEGRNIISLKKESLVNSYSPILFDFGYDSNGLLAQIRYNGKNYFYIRDILGNINGIINSSGNYIITYKYSVYGEITKQVIASSGDDLIVASNNPFMYKGYYYDEDLECYYLKTRFYMPSICRFISPDDHSYLDYEDLRGINLYCYCYDNPVMYSDPEGNIAITTIIILICIGIGATVGGTYAGVTAYNEGYRGWDLAGMTTAGVLIGGAIGGLVGYAAGPLAASLFGLGGSIGLSGGIGVLALSSSGVIAGTLVSVGAMGLSTAGALVANGLLMMTKGSGPRMGHNQYENKQIDDLCKKYKLTKDERRILHDNISGQRYTYKEIEQIINDLLGK